MAGETLRRSCDVASRMAGNTHEPDMGARQREVRSAMVECRRLPGRGCMTVGTQV